MATGDSHMATLHRNSAAEALYSIRGHLKSSHRLG
jgi:hypothetical protein